MNESLVSKSTVGVLVHTFINKIQSIADITGVVIKTDLSKLEQDIFLGRKLTKADAIKLFSKKDESIFPHYNNKRQSKFKSFKILYKEALESLIKNLKTLEAAGKVNRDVVNDIVEPLAKLEIIYSE